MSQRKVETEAVSSARGIGDGTPSPADDPTNSERPGAAFERLAAAVQARLEPGATVRWNEKLNGRQIDATVRGRIGSSAILVIIECRDYEKALGLKHVDALDSVRREVSANKAILVTRTGFTKPALEKAVAVGIDTCVLRPSEDDDHPGPGKPLRSIAFTIQPIGTNIRDLEVELVDGTRRPCGLFFQLEDQNGNRDFIDRVIKSWLQQNGYKHPNNTPLHLELTPPPKLLMDDEQPLVAKLHCLPDTGPSDFVIRSLWQAPEEWVFVQHTPSGEAEQKRFFEFPSLAALADRLKS